MSGIARRERLAGGLVGLLVGDALGVPYEFHPSFAIPVADEIEFVPPPDFIRAHIGVIPGTWSDDGAQALALLASLLECGRLDLEDVAQRLVAWYEHGQYAVDGKVFDVGIQTDVALRRLQAGVPIAQAAPADERSNGNGALMRALPLALWHRGTDAELVRDAQAQSTLTHGHLRSQVCCALYCLWARGHLLAVPDPWGAALATLRATYEPGSEERAELDVHVRPDDAPLRSGGGYVVDSLRSARQVLAAGAYEDVVKAAVALGDDTDTTACIAGGIAGVRDGLSAIPQRWREKLRGQDLLAPLLNGLLTRG